MNYTFKEDLARRLQDPDFKKEYDLLEEEYKLIQTVILSRKKMNLTQKELAELSGINQADISKIERGSANPTVKLLRKLANAMGMDLELRFVPKTKQSI